MKDPDHDLRQEVALFRYGVIADLLHLPAGAKGVGRLLREKSERSWIIPGSDRRHVAAETLRRWIALYRHGGFDALYPRLRADRGRPRRLSPGVAVRLVELKTDHPSWSVRKIIAAARSGGIDCPLAPSTVHRLLSREGLFDKKPSDGADRRRFAFREAGQLWMSDVMHGPRVRHGRTRRKTYLIAFIDDASRVIPFAAFAMAENVEAFLPVLKGALLRRGMVVKLYVDNGSAYRSRQLALVCAKLGIALVHARAHKPEGKGKIERFFRTLRADFLADLDPGALDSLALLNSRLWAWIEGEYHNTPHRGLAGRTPLQQWARASAGVRPVDPGLDLDDLFLFEDKRLVHKDRTVSLHGRTYEVDAVLVGRRVVLRHDPAAPAERPIKVVCAGKPAGEATLLDAWANSAARRARPSREAEAGAARPEPPPSPLALRNVKTRKEND